MDFGYMRMNYKKSGVFQDAWWPGFTINAAGFTFTRYAGETALTDTFPDIPPDWKPHGEYWNLGYQKTFTNVFNKKVDKDMKRPLIVPFAGLGFGGWKTHGGGAWLNLVLSGGTSINLINGLALSAGFQSGLNFKGILGEPIDPLVPGVQDAFPRFYLNPHLGFRFYYPINNSISGVSSSKEKYRSPGWYTYEYESDGWIYKEKSWSDGGYYSETAIVTTSEYISIAPVFVFPRSFDGVGLSQALGGKLSFRTGLLNADVQYMQGKVGFEITSGSFAGSQLNQCYWNMSQTSIAVGINAFNIFMPFRGPSLYRFIIGSRFSWANMEEVYTGPNTQILPPASNDMNIRTRNFFMMAEIGRFGLCWDFLNSPTEESYQSGGVLSAYYMIPLLH
jgi:hypothetical protein